MLQLGCVALLVVSWTFFFGGPILLSALALFCATVVVITTVIANRRVEEATGGRDRESIAKSFGGIPVS